MFEIVTLTPEDLNYPFEEAVYNGCGGVYHGSWSTSAASIEAEGLLPDGSAPVINTVGLLKQACEALHLFSASYFNLAVRVGRRTPTLYLSQTYWYARCYAGNPGGEAMAGALAVADELLATLEDPATLKVHLEGLKLQVDCGEAAPDVLRRFEDGTVEQWVEVARSARRDSR